jgi:hypothetical protein
MLGDKGEPRIQTRRLLRGLDSISSHPVPSDLSDALRSLRTTLLAGGLWLCALWLIFGHNLIRTAKRPDIEPLLDPLARAFGQVGAVAALSLAAFAVGALSLQIFRAPSVWLTNAASLAVIGVEAAVVRLIAVFRRSNPPLRRYQNWHPMSVDLARRLVENHSDDLRRTSEEIQKPVDELRRRAYDIVDRAIALELRGSAEEGSYARLLYERASAQLGLVVPVLAFSIALGWRVSAYLFVPALAAGTIGFAAVDYRRDLERELDARVWPGVLENLALGTRVE